MSPLVEDELIRHVHLALITSTDVSLLRRPWRVTEGSSNQITVEVGETTEDTITLTSCFRSHGRASVFISVPLWDFSARRLL